MKKEKSASAKVDEKFDFTKIKTLEQVLERVGITELPDMSIVIEPLRKPLMETYIVMLIIYVINNGWLADFKNQNQRKYRLYFWVRSDGSGFSDSFYDYVCACTDAGSRLYIESEEKARHILKHFEKEFENYHLSK
ncbi:MAG: hypothetical protein WCI31_06210 [Prolixibacteraceae bacterium]